MAKRIKVKFVERITHQTRDLTIGEVYTAFRLEQGSYEAAGQFVRVADGIKLMDDEGDVVYTRVSSGFELVEDDDSEAQA